MGSVSFRRGFPAARAPLREAEWRSTESSDDTFPVESSEDQEGGLIAALGRPRSSIVTLGAADKMTFSLTTGEALITIPKVTITVGIVSENQKRSKYHPLLRVVRKKRRIHSVRSNGLGM